MFGFTPIFRGLASIGTSQLGGVVLDRHREAGDAFRADLERRAMQNDGDTDRVRRILSDKFEVGAEGMQTLNTSLAGAGTKLAVAEMALVGLGVSAICIGNRACGRSILDTAAKAQRVGQVCLLAQLGTFAGLCLSRSFQAVVHGNVYWGDE